MAKDPKKSNEEALDEELNAEPEELDNGDSAVSDSDLALEELADDLLQEMMGQNFIEYASYSIKERAIPHLDDGLKPVQRRIMHALQQMDDGRFHKVANVIGQTMQYHPHGDASIGDALVVLANKEYFIEKQGNFGNIFTGDEASAARYIECRLTDLAREVMFNPEITEFIDSYDGRKKEPLTLPAKIPALLLLGTEGIAVGMRTRILPHNFNDVLKAQIKYLQGKTIKIYPDFPTAGTMDTEEYEDGFGKVKVRARIDVENDKTLIVREIPYGTTTESLMNSVEDAARKNKIKIAGINDFTAENVEIEITLPRGVHAKDTCKQLYAYTDCEINLSSQIIVIRDNRPEQVGVTEVIEYTTDRLVEYLKWELEIELGKLQDRLHEKSLVRIFIENRIYKRIEECETYDKVIAEVHAGLEPFKKDLNREVTDEDIEKLLQIQIRRISRFDLNKNQDEIDATLKAIEETEHHLANLTDYAIDYLKALREKYGKLFPRQTEITSMQEVDARKVALRNLKVGYDRLHHFVGTEVRNSNKNEDPIQVSEFDRLILLESNGKLKVLPVQDKVYVGQVKYLFRADKEQVYCMVYRDKKTGKHYAKRFRIDSYIMDREYRTIPKNCIIENIYTNYGVVVRCEFKHQVRGADDAMDLVFDQVEMRSRGARGLKIHDREISNFSIVKRGSAEPPEGEREGDDEDVDELRDTKPSVNRGGKTAKDGKVAPPAKTAKKTEAKVAAPKKTGESAKKSQTIEPKPELKAEPKAKPKPKTRIDEDTPFFLE